MQREPTGHSEALFDFYKKICYNIYVRLRKKGNDKMTIERMAVVDCYELEENIKNQFDLEEFDLLRAFFEMAENDSYQSLCIDEGSIQSAQHTVELYTAWEYEAERIEEAQLKADILQYLHDLIPFEETILVRVSW